MFFVLDEVMTLALEYNGVDLVDYFDSGLGAFGDRAELRFEVYLE